MRHEIEFQVPVSTRLTSLIRRLPLLPSGEIAEIGHKLIETGRARPCSLSPQTEGQWLHPSFPHGSPVWLSGWGRRLHALASPGNGAAEGLLPQPPENPQRLQNLVLEAKVSPFLLTGAEQSPLGNTYLPRARGHLHLETLSLLLGSPGPSGSTRMDPRGHLGPLWPSEWGTL